MIELLELGHKLRYYVNDQILKICFISDMSPYMKDLGYRERTTPT